MVGSPEFHWSRGSGERSEVGGAVRRRPANSCPRRSGREPWSGSSPAGGVLVRILRSNAQLKRNWIYCWGGSAAPESSMRRCILTECKVRRPGSVNGYQGKNSGCGERRVCGTDTSARSTREVRGRAAVDRLYVALLPSEGGGRVTPTFRLL